MDILCLDSQGKQISLPDEIVQHQNDNLSFLNLYASVPIKYEVTEIISIDRVNSGLGGLNFRKIRVDQPWTKDYDAEELPTQWAKQWDLENWLVIIIIDGQNLVAGAIVARDTKNVNMLQGRSDLAVLWDIRVHPDYRKQGLGKLLFDKVEQWCIDHDCIELRVETQNINVDACVYYQKMGMQLVSTNMVAYPDLPQEVQLIWQKLLK